MKKVVKCPICADKSEEACTLAAVERVVGDKTYVYCCENQEKRVKHR